ncbi:hypothetical protein [Streptomyces sp. NL15-2K]|uniref:hypothetical protein n=1 Tax=Streptomyces sp. NL15-2K TaxID=376149 RepID=UPI000FF984D5|nr:hypothetical protein [Kutzneria buriramensis]WKX06857.1 hypothetical protein Q4V64_04845 [Kutzneria buriramensis]GCB43875.1 chaperone protein htpG [Streptomyces sp. NL15-2K]
MSSRLTTSPACIVGDGAETDFTVVRRMRGSGLPNRPILEIGPGRGGTCSNPRHPLIERLNGLLMALTAEDAPAPSSSE